MRPLILVSLLAWILGFVSPSHAFPIPTVKFEKVTFPTIEVVTDPIPPATLEDTWLHDRTDDRRVPALHVEPVALPLTIGFVISSDRTWMRNDLVDNDRRVVGGLALVNAMMTDLLSRGVGATGSKVLIVTYDREARTVLPPTDPERVLPQPFGTNETYQYDGHEMVLGIELGLDQLSTTNTPRKLLVLVGGGHANDDSAVRESLVGLEQRARDEGVELAAVNYALSFTDDTLPRVPTTTGVFRDHAVTSTAHAVETLRTIVATSRNSYRIQFDARQLSWDGEIHRLGVVAGEVTFYGTDGVTLSASGLPRTRELSSWRWPLLALAIALLAAVVLALKPRPR